MIEKETIKKIETQVARYLDKMKSISDFIYKNPELGGEEYISSKYLLEVADKMGFETVENYCGIETSFMAEYKNGKGPVLAIIVEYDALPGFGPSGALAHACGHNWISAVGMGTGMILGDLCDEYSGTLRIIGTPSMENKGTKADMIKAHAFDDVDVVIQSHLAHYTTVACKLLALDAIEFNFRGRAAHASTLPEEGVNALDAVQFMFMGVNAMRPYLGDGVKMHGVISKGGETPSVVPDRAACQYYLRADTRRQLESVRSKVIRCAEGAALMAGAEMTMENFENPQYDMVNLPILGNVAVPYLEKEGISLTADYESDYGFASSDIGNVSHVVPTLYMEFDLEVDDKFRVHDQSAVKYVNSEWATRKLRQVSKIMVEILLELFNDEELVRQIKKEHARMVRENTVASIK